MIEVNVKGGHVTTIGWIWILGAILTLLAIFIEHLGVKFFSILISFYFLPIIYMLGLGMAFFGILRLFVQISSFYANTQNLFRNMF